MKRKTTPARKTPQTIIAIHPDVHEDLHMIRIHGRFGTIGNTVKALAEDYRKANKLAKTGA